MSLDHHIVHRGPGGPREHIIEQEDLQTCGARQEEASFRLNPRSGMKAGKAVCIGGYNAQCMKCFLKDATRRPKQRVQVRHTQLIKLGHPILVWFSVITIFTAR